MEEYQPQPKLVIKDLKTMRVIADPLHTQIYQVLITEPLTVKQVAGRLGLSPSKLYYHFDLMERHQLIQVVETNRIANMIEKRYQAAAREIDVDPNLFSFATDEGKEAIQTWMSSAIEAFRSDLLRSIQARQAAHSRGETTQPRKVFLSHDLGRMSEEQAEAFRERLDALVAEFKEISQNTPPDSQEDVQDYGLLVALYPNFYYPETRD